MSLGRRYLTRIPFIHKFFSYNKYRIPLERAIKLAKDYNVEHLIAPILSYTLGQEGAVPKKEQTVGYIQKSAANIEAKKRLKEANLALKLERQQNRQLQRQQNQQEQMQSQNSNIPKRTRKRFTGVYSSDSSSPETSDSPPPFNSNNMTKKRKRLTSADYFSNANNAFESPMEKYKACVLAIFLDDDSSPSNIPSFLLNQESSPDFDINMTIDDQGNSAVHWATTLARLNILKVLVNNGCDIFKKNFNGESALMRAVLVTNNHDNGTFKDMMNILGDTLKEVDNNNRTVLHHIALTSGIKGRTSASRYYLDCVLKWMSHAGTSDCRSVLDSQDKNGDTALNVSARIGNKQLVSLLLEAGASPDIANFADLRPKDFGLGEIFDKGTGTKDECEELEKMDGEALRGGDADADADEYEYEYDTLDSALGLAAELLQQKDEEIVSLKRKLLTLG